MLRGGGWRGGVGDAHQALAPPARWRGLRTLRCGSPRRPVGVSRCRGRGLGSRGCFTPRALRCSRVSPPSGRCARVPSPLPRRLSSRSKFWCPVWQGPKEFQFWGLQCAVGHFCIIPPPWCFANEGCHWFVTCPTLVWESCSWGLGSAGPKQKPPRSSDLSCRSSAGHRVPAGGEGVASDALAPRKAPQQDRKASSLQA